MCDCVGDCAQVFVFILDSVVPVYTDMMNAYVCAYGCAYVCAYGCVHDGCAYVCVYGWRSCWIQMCLLLLLACGA
eukprot:m.41877 g.41877  ORF g.41877 m.41877 type:complete len:75 (+) comp11867_c0_seq1:104-328(+)